MLPALPNLTLPPPLPNLLSQCKELLKSLHVLCQVQQLGPMAGMAEFADTSVNQRGQGAGAKGCLECALLPAYVIRYHYRLNLIAFLILSGLSGLLGLLP